MNKKKFFTVLLMDTFNNSSNLFGMSTPPASTSTPIPNDHSCLFRVKDQTSKEIIISNKNEIHNAPFVYSESFDNNYGLKQGPDHELEWNIQSMYAVSNHKLSNNSSIKRQRFRRSPGSSKPSKSAYKHIPHREKPVHLVAKRNARERRRVQAVNMAFMRLRRCVPVENRTKRLSKVKTLHRAIEYIAALDRILKQDQTSSTITANENTSIINENDPCTFRSTLRVHHSHHQLNNQIEPMMMITNENHSFMLNPSNTIHVEERQVINDSDQQYFHSIPSTSSSSISSDGLNFSIGYHRQHSQLKELESHENDDHQLTMATIRYNNDVSSSHSSSMMVMLTSMIDNQNHHSHHNYLRNQNIDKEICIQ